MVSATPSTDRSSVNGVEVKGVLFKNNAIDMAGNLYFPKDFSESRVDTDLHGGQFILIPPWPVAVPEILPRRHLVELRQGGIEVVPSVTARAVRHRLRLVSAWIIEAGGMNGEQIRHRRKR